MQPGGGLAGDGTSPMILVSDKPRLRIGHRRAVAQQLGVGMHRLVQHLAVTPLLDDPPEIHDAEPVAEMADDAEVVRDEQERQAASRAQAFQEPQDLRLHRDVERGDRLVGDDQLGIEHQRPGDADALALAAGEFVRIAVDRVASAGPTSAIAVSAFSAISLREPRPCTRSGSSSAWRMVRRGLSDE